MGPARVVLPAILPFFPLILSSQTVPRLKTVEVTILSTMLADTAGLGEWGFAALVEADGRRILFDTGARPETVLSNARELNVDLSNITTVVLSHNHGDHTNGLVPLRREYRAANPAAFSVAHAARGIFWSRPGPSGAERNVMLAHRRDYEALGGRIIEHDGPALLHPGAWVTGPVPRIHPERNYPGGGRLIRPPGASPAADDIPEDQSLILDTERGLVLVSGCGHAGIVNTLEFARRKIRQAPVYAAIGGFHLFDAGEEALAWTAARLQDFGTAHFLGAHCTGIEAVYRLRQRMGLTRRTCAVGAVGGGFTLHGGLRPGAIAR